MAYKLGLNCKLYRNTGSDGSPTWNEITQVKNLTLNLMKDEADASTRGTGGWKATVGTLLDGTIDFETVEDDTDADYTALAASYFTAGSYIDMAIMNGAIATSGTKGVRIPMEVFKFDRGEPLNGVVTRNVSMKATIGARAPAELNI